MLKILESITIASHCNEFYNIGYNSLQLSTMRMNFGHLMMWQRGLKSKTYATLRRDAPLVVFQMARSALLARLFTLLLCCVLYYKTIVIDYSIWWTLIDFLQLIPILQSKSLGRQNFVRWGSIGIMIFIYSPQHPQDTRSSVRNFSAIEFFFTRPCAYRPSVLDQPQKVKLIFGNSKL